MMFNPQSSASSTLTSREALLSMLERLPGALFVVDDAATIVYANASAQAITGAPREELLAHPFWRSAPQLVSASLYQAVLKTRQTQEPTEVEYWSPMTQTRLHVQLAPAMGGLGLTLQFHERREPARRQETIPQGEHLFSEGLDGLHAHIGLLTPEGMLLEINETPLKDAHIRREEAIGKPLAQAPWWSCPPMSQEHVRQAIARAGRGEAVRFDAMIHLRNGMNLDLEATITPHVDPDHHIEYLIYTATDVTAHKHTEDDLRALIDAIPQLVWMMRPDGSCEYCNQRWCDSTTMTAQQAQGDGWLQAIHPDDRRRVLAMWQTSVHTGMPYEAEHRLRQGTTGDYRWFLARGMPHKDAQGRILKWFGTCTDIEEQKQAEQRIKASEENFRLLAETVPQFVWVARPDGQFEYTNQRWCTYTGLTLEPGQSDQWAHRQCIHPDDREGNRVRCQHSLETGEMFEHEHRVRNGQTGEYRWFLTRGMPVHDKTGQLVKWFGTGTDIHEKKQAEDKIRALIDAIPHFVWIAGPDGYITYNNQRLIDYLAMPLEQVKGDGWMAGVHPDDRQRVWGAWQTAIQTGVLYEVEHRLQEGTSGAYRWFLVRGMPQRNAEGTILHWVGTCTDINEQKQAEQQLKESEENWRVLAETVPHLVWAVLPDGRLEYANQRACGYIGASPTYMPGEEWRQCLHPQDYERVQAVRRHALETGEPYEIEYRLKESHTGAYRWFLGRALPVRDDTGQIVKWFGTSTDIEDQKRLEAALRQSQERVNALMNSSIIGIFVDEGEQIVDANDTFLRMTGYTREDLRAGRVNWSHMTPPDDLARTVEAHQELVAKQSMTPYEKEYVCKDGSRLPVLVGGVVLEHHPSQEIAFVLDNSARKELEQRKDAFISMASHELRNPLTALKLQAILLHRQLAKQGLQASAPALSSMQTQINTVTRLVEELLDVSKIQAGRLEYVRETVDLDALLHEVADTMQQISPTHTVVLRGAAPCSLVGDKDRLGQVFINLLSNAIKYSPGAETVEMDLSASAKTATIRVCDHGQGIPQEQHDKIFERFYRVSGPSHNAIPGLGMGLYIVAEIVKHHGGTITVESEVGKGSTFQVTLPLQRDG